MLSPFPQPVSESGMTLRHRSYVQHTLLDWKNGDNVWVGISLLLAAEVVFLVVAAAVAEVLVVELSRTEPHTLHNVA